MATAINEECKVTVNDSQQLHRMTAVAVEATLGIFITSPHTHTHTHLQSSNEFIRANNLTILIIIKDDIACRERDRKKEIYLLYKRRRRRRRKRKRGKRKSN